ncbi:protein-L-isoaspartate(D-aspartate) O-methyltransferase [Edaphobacter modestus]|uniref:Protein-L-isoaspartate O-methyltransferase n=2 Tax=Edaphobacter modestus TaxID=388466 RepID=A0A4Q7YNU9_9BACT|nr:protein-L-isoaspartate(D-aspartate) O-methyltransferase [Edaphobacter modestus]
MDLAEHGLSFGRQMAKKAGLPENDEIARVFARTPRETFLGPPPWRIFASEGEGTLVDDPVLLYQDVLVQIKGEAAINNGQPSLHALCFAALRVEHRETVVHVGAGTGYYTSMLAQLTGREGRVDAYEIESDLAWKAAENLSEMAWVTVHSASGTIGPLPMCDVLYVNAGATDPLDVWLDAVRVDGRLLFPLTPDEGYGGMLLVTRLVEGYAARFLCGAKFVGCAGARDEAMARRLAICFSKGHAGEVRSLRRDRSPDETAWCAGANWWLSKRETPHGT